MNAPRTPELPRRLKPAADSAVKARQAIRTGQWISHTSGIAEGYVQGNVVILPEKLAWDFLHFCRLNPKPCPLIAVSKPGDARLSELGQDIDIRSDVPLYRVWRDGKLTAELTDIQSLWRHDFVSFVIGCSFTFEHVLTEAGIHMRHISEGKNVAMYTTNIQTNPAGCFHGPMVVSMRPLPPPDAIKAVQISSRLPAAHGAPVHIGAPEDIGIQDISKPDFGEAVEILPGELPVFWACGVTLQLAVMAAKPDLCITHAPGCMLITSLEIGALTSF